MTIFFVIPAERYDDFVTVWAVAKDAEELGAGVLMTDGTRKLRVFGSSRATREEADAMQTQFPDLAVYYDKLPEMVVEDQIHEL